MNTQQYLLTCLAEECAEVAQRATKAIRFGLDEIQPGQEFNNRERLEFELSDLMAVCGMLELSTDKMVMVMKVAKVEKFMDFSRSLGALEPKSGV